MASKSLEEALSTANIDLEIKKALCLGPLSDLVNRINAAENNIVENLKYELRDYFAHRVMILGSNASAVDLFNDIFACIPAYRESKQ
jgi:hypothetical protein